MKCKTLETLERLDNTVRHNYSFRSSKCLPSGSELSNLESNY